MNEQFWLGLLALPIAAIAVAVAWAALAAASKLWAKLHQQLLTKVKPARTAKQRSLQATTIGDALENGNALRMISGLGWVIVWARDSKPTQPPRPGDDEEDNE
ncbi:hypothetical protein [Cryobacterium zhongshanensis]|uniref:Uncharacterized protein n=1 Tax=Cryobacterium zhongshanensis TaxID=2928153 RepID=A0AA41UH89_9MICO|nr:hypothetical protein [Cryobacterium zhongshanensis]MCI4659660.1 hypothetical protein [Cryobacterium zhongshanensis]